MVFYFTVSLYFHFFRNDIAEADDVQRTMTILVGYQLEREKNPKKLL